MFENGIPTSVESATIVCTAPPTASTAAERDKKRLEVVYFCVFRANPRRRDRPWIALPAGNILPVSRVRTNCKQSRPGRSVRRRQLQRLLWLFFACAMRDRVGFTVHYARGDSQKARHQREPRFGRAMHIVLLVLRADSREEAVGEAECETASRHGYDAFAVEWYECLK